MDIPMNYLVSSGIRLENTEEFNKSFFKDIYRQALNTIALIIRTNEKKSVSKSESAIKDESILPIYDVQNTIAFTGRRGTGKTSAMLSVRNCLLNPSKITSDICEEKTIEEIKNVHFISLPKMIDASHLDVKEDLLEVIIANMLKELARVTSDREFDKREHGQKVEELQRRLTKVQNDYDSLIQTNGHTIPASYNMLIQGADKHHIQSEFKSIIDDYLYILSDYKINKNSTKKHDKYLVICIDDIDMYPGDPMLIMQCVYRYFTLPNVLLLTSWNYSMLYQYIYKHYYRRMDLDNKVEETKYSERERLCHEQSNDYLRKIVPFDKRIVMPSWRKSDYRDLIDKNISLYPKEEFDKSFKDQFPRLFPGRLYSALSYKVKNNENNISVKEFIFLMLADRTGVYLDASGYKPHFMEPDGLRSTFELFDSLYTMNNIRNDEGNSNRYRVIGNDEKIKQNYKLLLDTFYFKLLPSLRLNDEESDFFNTIYREKLSRRSKAIIDYYYILLQRNNEEKKALFDYENTIEDHCFKHTEVTINQDYSIGELFRILHHSTRLGLFSKQLVKAILASYSFILPYYFDEGTFMYYDKFEKLVDKNDIEKVQEIIFKGDKFKTLFGIFGGSLLGNWIYEMFGFKELHIKFSIENLRNFKPNDNEKTNVDNSLYALLNILMFIRIDRLKELKELYFTSINDDCYELETEIDPTAFFINAIRFDEFSKEIERLSGGRFGDIIKKRANMLTCYCISSNITNSLNDEDKERYPIFVLPLHQVDMIYNVIKRSLKEIMYISDSELRIKSHRKTEETDNENKTIESFYQNIIKYLSRVNLSYPVYDESNVDKNIFVERFYRLGLAMNLWCSTQKNDQSVQTKRFDPKSDEFRIYGYYKINPMFGEYCTFVTTEMLKKNNIDTMNSNKKTNDSVLLSEIIDEIVGKNKCKSITKKQTEKKESPAKKR